MASPFFFVSAALVAYAVAYWGYGKWYDRKVWKPSESRVTPAHLYLDGVEYFPVNKYVLWGYQFKSVAALGPILGPFIAVTFGWLPALLWIIFGNFFIGWLQDYGSIMVSVRNEGRSFGPIAYAFTGSEGRNTLLGFILFYILIITGVFVFFIATFFNIFQGTFWATLGVFATGVLVGHLLYKHRLPIVPTTIIGLVLTGISIGLGYWIQRPGADFLGAWTIPFWAVITCVILYLGSTLPMPRFIQPINFVAFFPTFLAILLILVGALVSPLTGVTLQQKAFNTWFTPAVGPLWPMMFIAIACGSISGWHSLVGSSSTSKQLDVETDAHPVGAGAMLTEGMLALASLAAYMVLSPEEIGKVNFAAWVKGATLLTSRYLGGDALAGVWNTFFSLSLVLYALTVLTLAVRFWRLVAQEVFSTSPFPILGHKHISTFVGLLFSFIFAITGSWINLWLYFGGSNQLLAGLALMLITIHLARVKAPTLYTLIPAVFMIITTLTGLGWQVYKFFDATRIGILTRRPPAEFVKPPLDQYPTIATVLNALFILVGIILIFLGLRMAYLVYQGYIRSQGETPSPPSH